MEMLERMKAILAPLNADDIASVMAMFRGVLEAMPDDDADGNDGPVRGRIETLLLGYEAGLKR
ncbi:hypothetical protein GCM10027403_13000 [Arthrobacter tecti]